MRQSKFSEAQIAGMLRDAASGVPVTDVTRKHGVSAATFYKWRAKFGGMTTSDMVRLRDLERENGRLKRMYADLSLEQQVAKEALAKKW